jgi:hypothetical protein
VTLLFTQYVREVGAAKRQIESCAARKTHGASTGLALGLTAGLGAFETPPDLRCSVTDRDKQTIRKSHYCTGVYRNLIQVDDVTESLKLAE